MIGGGRPEALIVRNLTAINGVMDADIRASGNGVLASRRPERAVGTGCLRELPSRMLNLRCAVVPLTGHVNEFVQLGLWRTRGAWLAAPWLNGLGGPGETQQAAESAVESAVVGWKAAFPFHGPSATRWSTSPVTAMASLRCRDRAWLVFGWHRCGCQRAAAYMLCNNYSCGVSPPGKDGFGDCAS
jgi:hypothetical protein